MNISNLKKFAWVFFALALTTTTVFSQGYRYSNKNVPAQNNNCLNNITGLTAKQQKQIAEMEEKHQESMAELRESRRSTTNAVEKNEIRGEMLKKVEAHRQAVKKTLSDEQQQQYDQLHAYGNYGTNQNYGNRRGNANFRGRGNYGRQNFARGNRPGNGNGNWNNRGRGNGRFSQNNCGGNGAGNGNFRGRGANFQNYRGNENQGTVANRGNNFRGRNAGYGRGNGNGNFQRGNRGRYYGQNNCAGSQNISDEGFEVIEETEFEEE